MEDEGNKVRNANYAGDAMEGEGKLAKDANLSR